MRDIDVIDVLRQVISFTTVCIYVYAIFAFVSVDVVCILVVPLPIGTVGWHKNENASMDRLLWVKTSTSCSECH